MFISKKTCLQVTTFRKLHNASAAQCLLDQSGQVTGQVVGQVMKAVVSCHGDMLRSIPER